MYCFRTHFVLIKYLYIITVLLQYVSSDKLSKCCTAGSVLVHSNDRNISFECSNNNDNVPQFIGINFDSRTSDESANKIPNCDSKQVVTFENSDSGSVSTNGCIDYLNKTLYGIGCTDYKKNAKVYRVNKCCDKNFSYHFEDRKCAPKHNGSLAVLSRLFRNSAAILKTTVPNCTSNAIFVEYHTNTHRLEINANGLKIKTSGRGGTELLPAKSFCIDELEYYDGTYNFTEIIVRACRSKSICERISCVHKCCKTGQIIWKRDDETPGICIDYDKHFKPLFYDVKFPLQANSMQLLAEPAGKPKRINVF